MIELIANKSALKCVEREVIASGAQNAYECHFQFSSDWDGLTRTAVFRAGSETAYSQLLGDDNICIIPWETLQTYGLPLYAGVYGTEGETVVLPTIWASIGTINRGVADAEAGGDATPSAFQEVLAALETAIETVDAAVAAEESRVAAEEARVAAENERAEAEAKRAEAESGRAEAEAARVAAEATRVTAETARVNAETERQTAEETRKANENARITAEANRAAAEAARQTAEQERVTAEAARVTAEQKRVSAEEERIANETTRQSAETERTTAETERKSAEEARTEAEAARAEAESKRASAEESRVSAEESRVAAENERVAAMADLLAASEAAVEAAEAAAESESNAAGFAAAAQGYSETAAAAAESAAESAEKAETAADALEAVCIAMLDGTNTTKMFEIWWALQPETESRYDRLSRWFTILAEAWGDKTYTLRKYQADVSSSSEMTPLDDLADGRSAGALATDADTDADTDWTEEDPMCWYIRANALSLADGTMDILAIEGEDDFDLGGDTAPVYTFAMALWMKVTEDENYIYKSFRTAEADGYWPHAGDVAPDNTKRAMTWHPTYCGGLTSDGKLTSGSGKAPYLYASATTGNTAAKKWDAYEGEWCDCDTDWLLNMWQLRHWNLENSGILEGCTAYNYQYQVAVAETGVKRVLLTATQAANLVAGSTVIVGDLGSNTSVDRWQSYMRSLADRVKIASIETVAVDETEYAAVYLDMEDTMDTTETTRISTMPWHAGSTDAVPGHKDGCLGSLTNGKYTARIAGVEVLNGAYTIGLDPLYNVTQNEDGTTFDYAVYQCRDHENLASTYTASGYEDTGITAKGLTSGVWVYVKEFVRNKLGILLPESWGGGSNTYYKSAFFCSASAGVRAPWRFCHLYNGGFAGLAGGAGNNSPGFSNWTGSPRLAGSGKKRGEWAV